MNRRQVSKQLGILILLLAGFMLTSLIWAVIDHHQGHFDKILWAVLSSVGICLVLGIALWYPCRSDHQPIYRREAIAVVGIGWLLAGVLGALPYLLSGSLTAQFPSLFERICAGIFESVSGFSCTGSTVFASPEDLPRALLFWRSLTHWLGGMGIVVLFVAILGQTGPAAKFMFSAEVPGPLAESIHPRVKNAALLLWKFYLALSIAEVIALCLQGMNLFDSLCHTFGTMATGGFSTRNASIGYYHSLSIEITIIVFMILAATNFNLYAALLQGRWRAVLQNKELHIYLLLLVVSVALVSADIYLNQDGDPSWGQAVRSASFNVTSVMTTTGFGVGDFNQWPDFSRYLIVMLMFVGGSAGSTSGAIKVIRFIIFTRVIVLEIERAFRPHVVRPLKVGGHILDDDLRRSVSYYIALHITVALLAVALLLMLQNDACVPDGTPHLDLESAFSAVAATLNGVGPGLNLVGATANFAFFNGPAKLLLSLLMILGRLEIMAILCLLMPSFWRHN
ncbi:MAG: TrkH family potassium uptake protein [Sedimentisphaerales bacterium]|nr:TrkH family potassium uptake protein [Sedimentisphaerales bacterium]